VNEQLSAPAPMNEQPAPIPASANTAPIEQTVYVAVVPQVVRMAPEQPQVVMMSPEQPQMVVMAPEQPAAASAGAQIVKMPMSNDGADDSEDEAQVKKVVYVILDSTSSMEEGCEAGSEISKSKLVRQALCLAAKELEQQDTEDDNKGFHVITFSNGTAHDLGLLNDQNIESTLIDVANRGHTEIMPAWRKMMHVHTHRFKPNRNGKYPVILAIFLTDGKCVDEEDFDQTVSQAEGSVFIELVVVGHGDDFRRAESAYLQLKAANPNHVNVTALHQISESRKLATNLLELMK